MLTFQTPVDQLSQVDLQIWKNSLMGGSLLSLHAVVWLDSSSVGLSVAIQSVLCSIQDAPAQTFDGFTSPPVSGMTAANHLEPATDHPITTSASQQSPLPAATPTSVSTPE